MPRSGGRLIAAALLACVSTARVRADNPPAPRPLGPGDCAVIAARQSTAANLIERQRFVETPGHLGPRREATLAILGELARLAALEARDRAADAGLELYYRLAGAEARRALIFRGMSEVDQALAQVGSIKARGLPSKVDEGALRRKRLDLENDGLELDLAMAKLRGDLAALLKLGPGPLTLVPMPPRGKIEPPDPNSAVAIGLARRPELRLLRLLRQTLDEGTAPAARRILAAANPSLSLVPPLPRGVRKLLSHGRDDADLCVLKGQIELFLADRERAVEEEVAQAARAIRVRLAQVEVARRQVASWEAEVTKADDRIAKGLATFAEAIPARAGLLKALDALIGREVELDLAIAKFRQTQGALACGSP